MRIALAEFEFDIKGSGNKAIFQPLFLSPSERNKVQAFIQFLNSSLGSRRADINFEVLDDLFSSYKISRSLQVSSLRFFSFDSQTFSDILQEGKTSTKGSSDIISFISEKTSSNLDILRMEVVQFRNKIFDYLNKNNNGFVSLSERDEYVTKLESEFGLPTKSLDTLMYIDLDSGKVLTKNDEIDPVQLIRFYNYDVIDTTLSFSIDLQMKLKSLPGYLAKKLVYFSKKNYVFSDIVLEEEGYRIKIEPPLEMFREKGGWGRNIANVATYILRVLLREQIPFQLEAIVKPRNRKALFNLDSKELPILPSFRTEEEDMIFRPAIDSKVEDQFLKSWRNYHGWKAIPEPEAIIVGKKMYVPDFLLERGDKTIYLEIVGFYTSKYIQKKKNQMSELDKLGIPIIYLIDESLQTHFANLRNNKILYYSGTKIPNQDLARMLDKDYSDFEERLPKFLETLARVCKKIADNESLLTVQKLNGELQTYSDSESEKLMTSIDVTAILQDFKVILLPSFGLVSDAIVQQVKDYMTVTKKISLSALKEAYPEYKDALIAISQHIGCSVKWKSIDDVEISMN